ncbi:Ribonuclease H domain - like 10 [Theobroma cacao]|nr:Ribonuclease H domain - like 10 [Theobroma cacao]
MKPDMLLKIKEEVKKQFDVGFLEVAKYPEWVANIVLLPKKDGKVMPFGLKNTGATYQRVMVTLFHDTMHREVELRLNPTKYTFGVTSGKLLGFVVSERRIEVDPDKVQAIRDLPPPKMQKEVRGFLERLNYIARFISQLTLKCDPIFKLFRKHNPGAWNEECQVAFDKVKEYLLSPSVLVLLVAGKPLFLYLTINEGSMGCVLGQHDKTGKKERAVYYLNKKFTEYESKYSSLKKMCCALAWTMHRLRVARWQVLLSEYDIVYVSQKAIKGSTLVDFLAKRVEEDYEPIEFEFPDEDLMLVCQTNEDESDEKENWKMFFDGASNALGHGIGVVLVSPEGYHYPVIAKLNFYCTNNVAKYEACVMGLQAAIERKIHALEVYRDFALVIYQLRGEWETRDSKLVRYHNVKEEVDGKPWYHDIVHYLKFQQYPEQSSENDKKTIRRLAMNFFLDGDILYKRSRDQVLLRCVDSAEARRIVEEVHEGICGAHASGHMLAIQVMRARYYWLTLETDCIDFAGKCHKCQIYTDKIYTIANSLHVLTSPWPFSMWGMDVIGLITPKASNGHRFILVAIDYFIKWVKAASYANVT